jgi:membrane glycosyltransferase
MALLTTAGLHPLSRFHLCSGIMSYLASPLWLIFLLVGMFAALQGSLQLPVYFFPDRTPYPVWQVIDPELAARLFGATMLVLLMPKLFGWIAVAWRPETALGFGGRRRALLGVLAETLFSALIAPVQMLLQSQFVFDVLVGRDSGWKTQTRDDRGMPFGECWQRHRGHMVAGLLLGGAAWTVYPALLAWMSPALLGMVIAAPVSWMGARLSMGLAARRARLFLIPEETASLPLLEEPPVGPALAPGSGLMRVTHDLDVGILHLALLAQHSPAEPSEAMILARYRASVARKREELAQRFDRRLQAAALADRVSIQDLRRHLGGFHQ